MLYIPWHFPLHKDPNIKGASLEAEEAFKNQYPAIYNHLLNFKTELSNRNQAETGIRYEWYALQRWGANYMDDFFQQKILFQEMVQESSFVLDIEGKFLCLDTARFIIGKDLNILLLLMNSKLFFFSIKYFYGGGGLGENGIRMKHTFFNKFHISNTLKDYKDLINEYLNEPIKNTFLIDELIYQNYNLSVEEVEYINSQ